MSERCRSAEQDGANGPNKIGPKGQTGWAERAEHSIYTENTTEKSTELFHQDLQLNKGDEIKVDILMSTVFVQVPDLSVHKNAIVVEIQNEVLDTGNSPLSHLLDVEAQLVIDGEILETVDIRDVIVEKEEETMILHYVVYDLCHMDEHSYISLRIEALDGKFQGFVSMEVIDLEAFSIQCTDKESETFIPREQHGA